MKEHKTVLNHASAELIINKSRFISHALPVQDEETALEFIRGIRQDFKDATHNVYAYILGEDMIIQRFSDDREPSGTAGLPIIELLKKENITNVVIVVTRYYGGIQLGSGGLIRAYSKAARLVLQNAVIAHKEIYTPLVIELPYNFWGKVQNQLETDNTRYEDPMYAEKIKLKLYIKPHDIEYFLEMLMNITSSDFSYDLLPDVYLDALQENTITL